MLLTIFCKNWYVNSALRGSVAGPGGPWGILKPEPIPNFRQTWLFSRRQPEVTVPAPCTFPLALHTAALYVACPWPWVRAAPPPLPAPYLHTLPSSRRRVPNKECGQEDFRTSFRKGTAAADPSFQPPEPALGRMVERRGQSTQEEPLQRTKCPALALHRPREESRGEGASSRPQMGNRAKVYPS